MFIKPLKITIQCMDHEFVAKKVLRLGDSFNYKLGKGELFDVILSKRLYIERFKAHQAITNALPKGFSIGPRYSYINWYRMATFGGRIFEDGEIEEFRICFTIKNDCCYSDSYKTAFNKAKAALKAYCEKEAA